MAFNTTYDTNRLFSSPIPIVPLQSSLPPRLCYFISRSNGTCVPLIPADELPYSVRLQDVPRVMSIGDTCGMQHVGALPYTGQYFRPEKNTMQRPSSEPSACNPLHVRTDSANSTKQFLAPDAMIRAGLVGHAATATTSQMPTSHPMPNNRPVSAAISASNWRKPAEPVDSTQAAIDAIIASHSETPARPASTARTSTPPSGSAPDQEKKVYCTHWIRHGECDYTQQGCLYKHEMPDRKTLETIGFRTVPRWYLEKTAPRLQGMSSLPTVGAPMKATEWLKRRSSSCSDADDESEASEFECESDDCKETADKNAPTTQGSASARRVGAVKAEAETMPTPPSTPHLFNNIRKLSLNDDLIDFAPLIPTPSSSGCSTLAASPASSTSSPLRQCSSESLGKNHPLANSPQKLNRVFVPAGESPEYHIAQARDRARSDERKSRPQPERDHQPKGLAISVVDNNATKVPASPQPKPVQISQRPILSGLMASKHAPGPAASPAKPKISSPVMATRPTTALPNKPAGLAAPISTARPSSANTRDRKTYADRHPGTKSVRRPRRPAGSVPSKAKGNTKVVSAARTAVGKTVTSGE